MMYSFVKGFVLSLCCTGILMAQTPSSFKFDFGTGKVAKGYTQVLPTDTYTKQRGYGFMPESKPVSVSRKGGNALACDYVTGDKPFFFTVDIPEGNYDVKVTLGDSEGTSLTTIKVENRRLMLEQFVTKQGEIANQAFTLNVRTPKISDKEQVHLKPRELNYLHWDNQLTFEFNGAAPKICGLEITKNEEAVTVFLGGNSTVVDQAIEPYAAWGQMIPRFFEAKKVSVANYAESGETIKSFTQAKRLDKVMSLMKKGDYFFIEFAHNDQKKGSGLDANTTYKEYIKDFIHKTQAKGGIPVLVTSMHRRSFDSTGHIVNTLAGFPAAMRQVAQEENVALIDLNAMSKTLWEAMGAKESMKAFVHYPANTFPNQDKELHDDTHFSNYGAYQLAKCIVEGIKASKLPLASYLKKDLTPFNPERPDAVSSFSLPNSPLVSPIKPDGN